MEELGWVDVEGKSLNQSQFSTQVLGRSMENRIYEGDYLVFEKYTPEKAGSRQGKIVLAMCNDWTDLETKSIEGI